MATEKEFLLSWERGGERQGKERKKSEHFVLITGAFF